MIYIFCILSSQNLIHTKCKSLKKNYTQLNSFYYSSFSPIALCLKFPIWIKGALGLFGLIYVLRILLIARYSFFKKGLQFSSNKYVYKVVLIFFAIIFTSSLYMHYFKPDKLFYVVRNNLKLWIFILFVYSFLSVLPQEIIYRSFFLNAIQCFLRTNIS